MSPTALRIVTALSNNPATTLELADACSTSKSSVHKIISTMQKQGKVEVIDCKTHIGWHGGRTPVPVYALKVAA